MDKSKLLKKIYKLIGYDDFIEIYDAEKYRMEFQKIVPVEIKTITKRK